MQILMIVGSEMGNAEMVGDLVKDELESLGHEVAVVDEGGLADVDFGSGVLLVVSSTTGLGDVPQNVEDLYEELAAEKPDLSQVRYGIVGMGDRNYKDTFCGGPKKWMAVLDECGAQRVGEPLLLDATDHPAPDEDAIEWLPSWLGKLDG